MTMSPVSSLLRYYRRPENDPTHLWETEVRSLLLQEGPFEFEHIGNDPFRLEFTVLDDAAVYRIILRGLRFGENQCSCPAFQSGTLGTCEHIEYVLDALHHEYGDDVERAFQNVPFSEIYLAYGVRRLVRFRPGVNIPAAVQEMIDLCFDKDRHLIEERFFRLAQLIDRANEHRHELILRNDVSQFLARLRHQADMQIRVREAFPEGVHSARFERLLKVPIPMFQRDSILAAAEIGRFILGDPPGLDAPKQAIAVTEILASQGYVGRAIIFAEPSRLFSWERKISELTSRSAEVVSKDQSDLKTNTFFKIISYDEQVPYLGELLDTFRPQLAILDDAHYLRELDMTSIQTIKRLDTDYLLILPGTDPVNRPGPFLSFVDMIDRERFGYLDVFLSQHTLPVSLSEWQNDTGETIEPSPIRFTGIDSVSETLKSIYMRRTTEQVRQMLPPFVEHQRFLFPSESLQKRHSAVVSDIRHLLRQWRGKRGVPQHRAFELQENIEELQRLCSLPELCNGKLTEILRILSDHFEQTEIRSLVFARYDETLDRIAHELELYDVGFVRLTRRQSAKETLTLQRQFEEDADCRIMLLSDSLIEKRIRVKNVHTMIHVDRPWNPDQLRHRLAVTTQSPTGPIHVFHLIWKNLLDESLLNHSDKIDPHLPVDLTNNESIVLLDDFAVTQFFDNADTVLGPPA